MERVAASWKELVELVDQVQDAGGLTQKGADGWMVKDHLVHVAAWEHSLLGLIEGRSRLEAMGLHEAVDEKTDSINEAVRKLHEGDTADEALSYFRESHAQLSAALGKLSDADLQKPYSHYQSTDPAQTRPVIDWVAGNTYDHYAEHIAWINQLITESSADR
ncbi:MAG: ClbS/DfsB family four-helix bundle protein [Candidatus Dormibacteraeota bacterium]|nr:ClbS/DfsB family four-helix bundle protein [Candidatus Dormibacteraeota bacterium]